MTFQQIKSEYLNNLNQLYDAREISVFVEMIMENYFSLTRTDLLLRGDKEFDATQIEIVFNVLGRLKLSEPIQYIIEQAHFYGLIFKVNPHTLIPRQETEELIYLIAKENKQLTPKILDIGTGSGCIAITLKKEIPLSEVFAVDFSLKALEMAALNAKSNNIDVHFSELDILSWHSKNDFPFEKLDIIVSNPPYIRLSEKALMHTNVLNYEPETALFVEDSKALIFYEAIAKFALCFLKAKGKLYFEINEAFGIETAELLSSLGFKNCSIHKDLNGKNRFVSAELY